MIQDVALFAAGFGVGALGVGLIVSIYYRRGWDIYLSAVGFCISLLCLVAL